VGRDAAREGKEGEPSRAGLAARSLAVRPKAQEGVSEPAAGQNRKRAASTEKKISSFLISEAFLDVFYYSFNFYSILHQRVYCLEIKEYSNASENRIPTCFHCKVHIVAL